MKAQTAKPVACVPLNYGDDILGLGTPDPDRVIPAHRRKQGPALMETQRDDRSPMAFQNAAQLDLFISSAMPYQAPGSLAINQYWAITAYLADQHLADAHGQLLGDGNATNVALR